MLYPARLEIWLANIETPRSGGVGYCLQSKVTLGYLVLSGDYCVVVGFPALTSRDSSRPSCLVLRLPCRHSELLFFIFGPAVPLGFARVLPRTLFEVARIAALLRILRRICVRRNSQETRDNRDHQADFGSFHDFILPRFV